MAYTSNTYNIIGAKRLANTIMRHWRNLGHSNVVAETFLIIRDGDREMWGVKSNLVNGLPPVELRMAA